jgi:Protein kinase domain
MTHPEDTRSDGAAVVTSTDEPLELPLGFRSGVSERGIDLDDEIGRGAMSLVYRATDRDHARTVAVKILRPSPGADYDPGRFLREIQLAAGLQHPHILPVYGSGTVDGMLYYVMPYVDGESLRARLNRIGPLPVQEAIQIAREVADALDYAHDRGVVHRDIKPENILLEAGHAVVADFGVALVVSPAAQSSRSGASDRLTSIGMIVGTPAYMSPEQASGDGALDGRSDLYALGCVLYEMLAGKPPFSGPTPNATIARRFQGPPTPLRQRRPEVPPSVAAAIDKALAVEPSERFPTGAEFAAALATAERRRGLGRVGIAVLVGSLAVSLVSLVGARIPHRRLAGLNPRRVAVAALSNETGDTTLAPLGRMVASWITDRLGGMPGVAVVTSATVVPAQHDQHFTDTDADDPERLHSLATETRAGTLVSGSYYRGGRGMVEFHVEITDANTGRLIRAIGPVMADGDPERTADQLSTAVAATVDTVATTRGFPIRERQWPGGPPPDSPTR